MWPPMKLRSSNIQKLDKCVHDVLIVGGGINGAVAAAALFIDGTTGWLGTATTEARGRGQGLQRALIARRINDAVTAGCTLICTETGEPQPGQPSPSYHNILASGFDVVGLRRSLTG